jgi:uncharacterized membrane protein YesL
MLGKYPNLVISAASYSLVLISCSLSLAVIFYISAYHKSQLKSRDYLKTRFLALAIFRISTPVVIHIIAFAIAFAKYVYCY